MRKSEVKFYNLDGKLEAIWDIFPDTPAREVFKMLSLQCRELKRVSNKGIEDILSDLFGDKTN